MCAACGSKLLLRDRYRVIKSLGQGGFGATFLARNESLPGQPYCVIKQLRPASSTPQVMQMARELFRREAKTLGKIGNHPQVPGLLDYFETDQEFYLVQEYISGSTLHREVKRGGPFTEAGVKQFLSEILPVIDYIHSQEVIHRDIKPANLIRRNQDKKLVLIDFGAVKDQVNPTASANSDQTALTAFAIGTPGYAPPEQMALRPVYASDIYALGVTCIYLLTSKSPKDLEYDPSTGEMLWQKNVRVSDHLANVLKKMLEVSVRHRYKSAREILGAMDLEPYLDSLAQSMLASPGTSSQPGSNRLGGADSGRSDRGSSGSNHSDRMAMRIRRRNTKLGGSNLDSGDMGRISGRTRATSVNSGDSQRGGPNNKIKRSIRLNSEDLRTYYDKGRRDFVDHDLSNLNLQQADFSEAIFRESKFVKTDLRGANLFRTDFGKARLKQTNLRDANLSRAYFNYANLEGADLRGADLSYAYLSNANLRGANLCGSNLTGAKITEEQLKMARTNWATVLPNGKRELW